VGEEGGGENSIFLAYFAQPLAKADAISRLYYRTIDLFMSSKKIQTAKRSHLRLSGK
jgi:hypothetical protein